MLRHSRLLIAVGALALVSVPAMAQHAMGAKHELGIDLSAYYASYSLGGVSVHNLNFGAPVDVRIGFMSQKKMNFEGRLAFNFHSAYSGGSSWYGFAPQVNVLWPMGKAKARNDNKYFTAGIGLNVSHNAGVDGMVPIGGCASTSCSQIQFNGGVGMRSPWESGAYRLEAFLLYGLKSTSKGVPTTLAIGARVGASLWH